MPTWSKLAAISNLSINQKFSLPILSFTFGIVIIALSLYVFIADLRHRNELIYDVISQKNILLKLDADLSHINEGLNQMLFLQSRKFDAILLAKAEDFQSTLIEFRDISTRQKLIYDQSISEEMEPVFDLMRSLLLKIVSLSVNNQGTEATLLYQQQFLVHIKLVRQFSNEALYGKTELIQSLRNKNIHNELVFSIVFFLEFIAILLVSNTIHIIVAKQLLTPINQIKSVSDAVVNRYAIGNSDTDTDYIEALTQLSQIKSTDEVGTLAKQFFAMIQTIDKGTQAEMQKKHAMEKLNQDLTQKNNELEQAHRELALSHQQLEHSAKLSSLGEMSAGIAHEINQPLGVIRLYTDSMIHLFQGHSDKSDKMLAKILTQIERVSKIISHLKLFSRDGKGHDMEYISVSWLIEESLVLLSHQLKQDSIALSINIEDQSLQIMCNSIQLLQVLTNLVSNAKYAVNEYCLANPLKSSKKSIIINVYTAKQLVFIEVCDTGTGMSKSTQAKIFQPFYTTKPVGKGTGLGLSICYGILKEHGGSIKCNSTQGNGSIFTINLPESHSNTATLRETYA